MSIQNIPFFRPSVGEAEIDEVTSCLRSGWLTTGPKARAFEEAFGNAIGPGAIAIAVNSATAALHLALEALGITDGDEVILPTLTFTATAEVVRYLGAKPVLIDIDPDTLCVSPERIQIAITDRTKAVMPVHFGGRPCPMNEIRESVGHGRIKIVDDAAHAFPASHAGRPIGDCGADATAFSFYANKTMTTGEGGMLVTRESDLAERARKMRLHGIDHDVFDRFTNTSASWIYDVVAPGFKYNMTDIAAALGIVQLRRTAEFLAARERLAARYDKELADLPLVLPPHAAAGDVHSWHLYIVQLTDDAPVSRDEFIRRMQAAGIGCSVHYRPLHQMSVWEPYCADRIFPVAENYFQRCVSLPLFMSMSDGEQERVIEVTRNALVP